MLNNKQDTWQLHNDEKTRPELNKPVIILVEHDIIHDANIEFPFTRLALLESYGEDSIKWKLLDFDAETEEEYLHWNSLTVVAWRYYE